MNTLNREDAALALGISSATLTRWLRSGKIQCTRTGAGVGKTFVTFTYAQLGLKEPTAPAISSDVAPQSPAVESDEVQHDPSPVSEPTREELDRDFAQRYLAGEATDSAGNDCRGNNVRWPTKGTQSLIGPYEPEPEDSKSHVNPLFLSRQTIGTDGQPITHAGADNHPKNAWSQTAEWKAELNAIKRRDRRRYPGLISCAQQLAAQERSRVMIRTAFPKADKV